MVCGSQLGVVLKLLALCAMQPRCYEDNKVQAPSTSESVETRILPSRALCVIHHTGLSPCLLGLFGVLGLGLSFSSSGIGAYAVLGSDLGLPVLDGRHPSSGSFRKESPATNK